MAKRRLADEYDAAHERGKVAEARPKIVGDKNTFQATTADLGLDRVQVFEERLIKAATEANPNFRRILDADEVACPQ